MFTEEVVQVLSRLILMQLLCVISVTGGNKQTFKFAFGSDSSFNVRLWDFFHLF